MQIVSHFICACTYLKQEKDMLAGLWIPFLLLGVALLTLGLHVAVKRGGRKVEPINPQDLIIFPEENNEKDESDSIIKKRLIPLEGAFNFRDLGGYHIRDGRRTIWGRVYRSDEFSELSDADLETLNALGLRSFIDLRSPRERKGKENRLPAGSTYHQIRIYKREPFREYVWIALFQRHALPQALGDNYINLVETRAETFGSALHLLTNPQNLPLVYHCSAGKDRTGIVAALILSILGVPEETIIADYSLSNLGFEHFYTEFVESGRLDRWAVPYEEFQGLFLVQPSWMRNLLAHLKSKYGSVEDYLICQAGLTHQDLDSIRKNLL
jgi:protein-tyrosine phosphatase